jgi:hypothetical protein
VKKRSSGLLRVTHGYGYSRLNRVGSSGLWFGYQSGFEEYGWNESIAGIGVEDLSH